MRGAVFFIFILGFIVVNGLPLPSSTQLSPSDSRYIPTPADDVDVPLPGKSGVFYHEPNGNAYLYYGDDTKGHTKHLAMNQELYPENRLPMKHASQAQGQKNRDEALRGIPARGREVVRDEKPIASLLSKNHAKTTTVQYLPERESNKESHLAKKLSRMLSVDEGPGKRPRKGVLVPNPSWLYIDKNQRIGHEAFERVPDRPHTMRNGAPVPRPKLGSSTIVKPIQEAGSVPPKAAKKKQGKGKEKAEDLGPIPDEIPGTNLISTSMISQGHAWKSSLGEKTPSHVGAPSPFTNRESRNPPTVLDAQHFKNEQIKKANRQIFEEKLRNEGVLHEHRRPAEPLAMDIWPPVYPHRIDPLHPASNHAGPSRKRDGKSPGPVSEKHGSGSQVGSARSKGRSRAHSDSAKRGPYPPPWMLEAQSQPHTGSPLTSMSSLTSITSSNERDVSLPPSRSRSSSPPDAGPSRTKGKGRARSPSTEQQPKQISSGQNPPKEQGRGRSSTKRGSKLPAKERSPSEAVARPSRSKATMATAASPSRGRSQSPPKAGPSNPKRNNRSRPPSPGSDGKQVSIPSTHKEQSPSPRRTRGGPPKKEDNHLNTNRPQTRASTKGPAKSPQPRPRTRARKP